MKPWVHLPDTISPTPTLQLTSHFSHPPLRRCYARQSLICRGLLPFLAAPSPNGEQLLEDAICSAARLNLVQPGDHIVVVQRVHEDFCIKIVGVNESSSVRRGSLGGEGGRMIA